MEAVQIGPQVKGRISDEERDFVSDIHKKVVNDDTNREAYKIKLVNAHEQRQGFITIKNWPWPGAAEFTVPFTDKTIIKNKSVSVLALTNSKKWVIALPPEGAELTPELMDSCRKQEIYINHILQNKNQNFRKKLTRMMDSLLEKGKFIVKVRAKINIRDVSKTMFVGDFVAEQINKFSRQNQLPAPADPRAILEDFKKRRNEELYPFLIDKYGFDIEVMKDKKVMDDILRRFKRGEKEIDFKQREVTQRVDIVDIMPENFVVPRDTMDMQDSPRVTHEFWWTKEQLMKMAEDGFIEEVDEVSGSFESFSNRIDLQKSLNEGIVQDTQGKDMFRVLETIAWFKGGFKVFLYLPDNQNRLLKKPHPIPHSFPELEEINFPYLDHNLEEIDGRYYSSRGYPERLQSIQEAMDMTFNNMINRDVINNTPMFLLKQQNPTSQETIRFVPGQIIRENADDVRRFESGASVDISSERISQIAKAFGEEYVGSLDFAFNNAANPGGSRTATEIDRLSQNAAPIPQLDLLLVMETLSKLATMCFSVGKERFGRPMFIKGVRITKKDLEVPCEFKWNGSLEASNKILQAQKAFARVGTVLQLPPTIVNDDDRYNVVHDWLDKDGINDPDRYITRPEEQAQVEINKLQRQIQNGQQMVLNLQTTHDQLQDDIIEAKKELIDVKERVVLEVHEAQVERKKRNAESV